MRVVGCLSWFEESPNWLSSLVASCHGFVDHFVAVDGAYFLFPDAVRHPVSGSEQADAIVQTCTALGIGCTVHVPAGPWFGNETEKRSFLFRLGMQVASPFEDWLFVVDGDDLVDSVPGDARKRLERSAHDAAEVSLWWREDWERTVATQEMAARMGGYASDDWMEGHRALFRANPSLRCGYAHMIYEIDGPDGAPVRLRGQLDDDRAPLAPAEDLTDLRVEHRHQFRNPARRQAAAEYYLVRDECGVERLAEQHGDGSPVVSASPPF